MQNPIHYTLTDEAPFLATFSFLSIAQAICSKADVPLKTVDISLASRILAKFSDILPGDKKVPDGLANLGKIVKGPGANIIKLPNISASVPQIKAAIKELQEKGYPLPDYPENPKNETEKEIQKKYDSVKGSAVNPVLREGNSLRFAPRAVKEYARQNPHNMGSWSAGSKTHVATMSKGDFRNNEQSVTIGKADSLRIEFETEDGTKTILKEEISSLEGEIIDASLMSKKQLIDFIKYEINDAKEQDILFSIHLKATMMKVSDPIIFGHAVECYFEELFEKHGETFKQIGVNVRNGFQDLIARIRELPDEKKAEIKKDIEEILHKGPNMAMVNSDKGITNLHVPNDVIIDASMPAMIRNSGKMWDKNGNARDTKAMIPDSSYAGIYQATIDFCKKNGAFDPRTMGSVSNVGLMALKAEEYGSHDKTFEIEQNGTIRVLDQANRVLTQHKAEAGDIWRMCQVKDIAVRDWVKLAVNHARETGNPAIFWLDKQRAHDSELIKKVNHYLLEHDTRGIKIRILPPDEATYYTLERTNKGLDTISVTGNVLRDYLTDLFPILEVGTSAKMLSIVPLLNGGGLFETGAGGSAPKHVEQFLKENHLRWDSLGEFLALAESLKHFSKQIENKKARILAETLDKATTEYLLNDKSPSRKVGEPDNRTSHFYLALYWVKALSEQENDLELKKYFLPVMEQLLKHEETIVSEINSVQGKPANIGGYYHPEKDTLNKLMKPSKLFNQIMKGSK
jgi:isocitrate dehydrogenase